MCVIILMKIINENDMRSETGGSDSSKSTGAPTPCSYFGSSKVESLETKNLSFSFLSLSLFFCILLSSTSAFSIPNASEPDFMTAAISHEHVCLAKVDFDGNEMK